MKRLIFTLLMGIATLVAMPAQAKNKTIKAIERIEPSNWWAGMNNPNLQLLVRGNNIASTDVAINYDGVVLAQIIKTDNPNYLFLDLKIAPTAAVGTFDIVFKRNGKAVATYAYELKQREAGSAERVGFNSTDAVYLVMPDRFANGDPTNDNMAAMFEKNNRNAPYGRHGGDLKGIEENLEYIANLGMTALWLNPVQENNMPQSSYHGYAITDYYAVDARLGTLDEYKQLVDKCHQKGLKMIMDMVFNHCGTNHWWMNDLPTADWVFKWDGEYVNSSYRLSTVADPNVAQSDLRQAVEGWFDTTMADINMRNPLVKNYLIQNSIWWIETVGLDGIRQDTYPYPDKYAMQEWNLRIREEYPNFNIVGEAWISQASKLCYWQKDFPNRDGFNSELPTIMDFPLQEAICRAFTEPSGWDSGVIRLYDALADDHLYPNVLNMMTFGENHDVGRLYNQVGKNIDNLKLATAFLATVRGIPQLYVGTEVLMEGNGFDGHALIREDFPGGWQGDDKNYLAAEGRKGEVADMYDYTAKLFNYRRTSAPLQTGKTTHFIPRDEVYVFFRHTDSEAVMVLINNNIEQQTVDMKRFAEILGKYNSGKDIVSETQITTLDTITIAPKTAMVVELK